jgi:apolipoprotein N-acyltransferase
VTEHGVGPGKARRLAEPALLAAAGAVQTLAFVHTQHAWLPVATLALLVWRLNAATPGRAAWLAWCYGTAWLTAGTWWLFISLYRYGGLPAWMAVAAVLALAAALSLYLAVAGALYARGRRGRALPDVFLFAALWLLAEWARTVIFTGFPWVVSGYAQVDSVLAAWAPWVGVLGMGALAALVAAALGHLLPAPGAPRLPGSTSTPDTLSTPGRPPRMVLALLITAVLLPGVFGPVSFTQPAGELSVRLLQTNVAQDEKFAAEHLPETLSWVAQKLIDAGNPAPAALSVAPETAVPLLPAQLADFAPGYWEQLRARFAAPGPSQDAALVGVPLGDFDSGYTNSVIGLGSEPQLDIRADGLYRYDKLHLVPFGEFVPTGFRWFTAMMNIPLGDFARGVRNPPSFQVAGQRVAPNICYEDLFGEELAARFIDPALAPTVLANVSNIGWFGNTVAIPQHLAISRLRSLEFQRPMLRATNTGATAVVSHTGEVTAQLPPHTRGVLAAQVQGRSGTTPFAWWAARWSHWPWLVLGLSGALLLGRWRGVFR